MAKKVLAIDLDEVIRSKWIQFERFYAQEFGETGIKMPFDTYDLRNHFEFKDTTNIVNYLSEDLPEDVSPIEYIVDKETGVAPVDAFAFNKKSEFSTADEVFHKFLYEDFVVEVFGSAPVLYRNLEIDLRKFKVKFQDNVDMILFSTEKDESISPSLFFLSKIRPNIRKYIFTENPGDIWKEADMVITSDPKIIAAKGSDQKLILINRPHNTELTGDYSALNLVDLIDDTKFKEIIDQFTSTEQK